MKSFVRVYCSGAVEFLVYCSGAVEFHVYCSGIQIAVLSYMAPSRRGDISATAFRAFIAGEAVTGLPIYNEIVKTT